MSKVILSLGSNVGDRLRNLRLAIDRFKKKFNVSKVSSIYLTSPVDYLQQDDFYNLCLELETNWELADFHRLIKEIEIEISVMVNQATYQKKEYKSMPQKDVLKGPRIIDIDIIFFGDEVVKSKKISVPHLGYRNRLFVIQPLLEISPEQKDPETKEWVRIFLDKNDFSDQLISKLKEKI